MILILHEVPICLEVAKGIINGMIIGSIMWAIIVGFVLWRI